MSDAAKPTETVLLLRSIDLSLRELVTIAKGKAEQRVKNAQSSPQGPAPPVQPATDRELDDPKFGDPEAKFTPRDWTGEPIKGRHFSQCPAEALDMLADALEIFAERAEANNELASNGKPKAQYDRLTARRARGWAARVRAGHPKTKGAAPDSDDAVPEGWA